MTKEMIAKALQEKAGLDAKVAKESVDLFLSSVKEGLKNGEKVSFVGFGTFSSKTRPARTGLNPKTGKPIEIPGKRVPFFKPGKNFRDRVDGLDGDSFPE